MVGNKKVSIIVPIYKVEKYIDRCIKSILQQTYTHFELILVNDGSPDRCGEIINDYAKKDARIKVVHKENGGLSDARNRGMKEVTGEFTMFIDSDDWIIETMIETLLTQSIEQEADIVQGSFYYAYEDKLLVDKRYQEETDAPIILRNKSLMYELVTNKVVKNFAWGKLYKTSLIQDIPFTKGVLFEDVFWAHHVMHNVNTYVILQQPMYYYCQRDDSIVATYSIKNLDIIKGLKERHQFIEAYHPTLIKESYQLLFETMLVHYYLLQANKEIDKDRVYRNEIVDYIKSNSKEIREAVKANQSLRRQRLLFSIHPIVHMASLGIVKGLRRAKLLSRPTGLEQVSH
ncbi:MAG TPA: glycosyltransferase [Virgibacillus sp.]|nr:glycosyltransferase [Virgibacillus sp.]